MKMSLEELREFLQEKIAESFDLSDDIVIEQLQVSMTELRKMKLDLPSPGYILHAFDKLYICSVLCYKSSVMIHTGRRAVFRVHSEDLIAKLWTFVFRPQMKLHI